MSSPLDDQPVMGHLALCLVRDLAEIAAKRVVITHPNQEMIGPFDTESLELAM